MKSRERREGVTLVHTGEGKGKSSSAFGVVFRAAGWGMKVCVIQYIKGKWKTGEQQAAEKFDNIEWHAMGDGFTWDTQNPDQDIKTSRHIWAFSRQKNPVRGTSIWCCSMRSIIAAATDGFTGQENRRFLSAMKKPKLVAPVY